MVKISYTFFQKSRLNLRSSFFLGIVTAFLFSTVSTALAANIVLSPANVSTKVGKTFSIDVLVNNNKDPINAVSGLISFPADVLSVSSISKGGSFITLWAEEPTFSNAAGTVNFEGVALNPGFSGQTGKVVTITFKSKQAGNINILVKSGYNIKIITPNELNTFFNLIK